MSITRPRDGDDLELRLLLIETARKAGHDVAADWTNSQYSPRCAAR